MPRTRKERDTRTDREKWADMMEVVADRGYYYEHTEDLKIILSQVVPLWHKKPITKVQRSPQTSSNPEIRPLINPPTRESPGVQDENPEFYYIKRTRYPPILRDGNGIQKEKAVFNVVQGLLPQKPENRAQRPNELQGPWHEILWDNIYRPWGSDEKTGDEQEPECGLGTKDALI
jgi:hypothetical protein